MKVFISWSGVKSHSVAVMFRDWLPSVIQSIQPYVSSEDIDKGERWSMDIAHELENSSFGILCVTKDNLKAPWLAFEAGALSKTVNKSYVTPFLFDIKRSEVNGPILQFQSTVFEKGDIKKLLSTINKACAESGISDVMLHKAFELWYPALEEGLNKIANIDEIEKTEPTVDSKIHNAEILEEILDLSRNNQKILRNPELKLYEKLTEIEKAISQLSFTKQTNEKNIFDVNTIIKSVNIENLQNTQEHLARTLNGLVEFIQYDNYGNSYEQYRFFLSEIPTNEDISYWLDSLKIIINTFKLSKYVHIDELFKNFHVTGINFEGNKIPYKLVLDLYAIYNSLEKEDYTSLVNTIKQQFSSILKVELKKENHPTPIPVDDLPF